MGFENGIWTGYPKAKTATDNNGKKIKIGDTVIPMNIYTGKFLWDNPVKVVDMHRQGVNGTIVHCDVAPNPEYPHHKSIKASAVIKKIS